MVITKRRYTNAALVSMSNCAVLKAKIKSLLFQTKSSNNKGIRATANLVAVMRAKKF